MSAASQVILTKVRRWLTWATLAFTAIVFSIVAANFPYDVDAPLSAAQLESSRQYYAEAYKQKNLGGNQATSDYETKYIQVATEAAEFWHIKDQVSEFVSRYGLSDGKVLDIGSGRGYLQDVVQNYTGLDISTSVSRFYHKKFVLGSATAMPFPDSSFDGAWSVSVLEHVPNPEQALTEIRRVMKNNGVVFLRPAWNCKPWTAQGYNVRPYSDFDLKGKLIKASVPLRSSLAFRGTARIGSRMVRGAVSQFGSTRLRYRRLEPNYKEYWEADSDAVNDIDRFEAMLWFRTRGDECLNCGSNPATMFVRDGTFPLIVRIHK
jgi:SAM-dependent methyltransferase